MTINEKETGTGPFLQKATRLLDAHTSRI